MPGIRRSRFLALFAAAALGAVGLGAAGVAPAAALTCGTSSITTDPGFTYTTVNGLEPTSLLTPGAGADAPRVKDFTFCSTNVVPNSTGFNVPKVPLARARVILPSGYNPAGATRYPVLYLLHGGGVVTGTPSYADWSGADISTGAPAAPGTAFSTVKANPLANTGLIIVQPAGGNVGLYTDWNYADTHTGSPRYESFHINQLIPWIDANFKTWNSTDGRAIAGLSMGGQGAMHYVQAHPTLFKAVASFSGAFLDGSDNGYGPFARFPVPQIYSNALGAEQSGDLGAVNGGTWLPGPIYKGSGPKWDATNVLLAANIAKLANKDVTITVGANDPTKPVTDRKHCEFTSTQIIGAVGESMNCVVNGELNKRILASGVAMSSYTFYEAPGVGHDWPNWNPRFTAWLPHLMSVIKPAGV